MGKSPKTVAKPVVISVSDVWRKFRICHQKSRSLKEIFLSRSRRTYEEFWALKEVSFDVKKGQALGIIGENGSGKSTLLKLLTHILKPDKGEVHVEGKISALLELGAGFHPELTGRENVYLNGAILGLKKREIEEKFDEIVSFSGLEKFIDTPVKNYSSGMYMRLAFAVAINVDPDILLIDEVLAVGDEAFQGKCLTKIDEFKKQDKTIVFVSHNLDMVRNFCDSAIWLDNGILREQGSPFDVASSYLWEVHSAGGGVEGVKPIDEADRWGTRDIEITNVELLGRNGEPKTVLETGEEVTLRLTYLAHKNLNEMVFGFAVYRSDGIHITGTNTSGQGLILDCPEGEGAVEYKIASLPFLGGDYLLSVSAHNRNMSVIYDWHERRYRFRVSQANVPVVEGVVYAQGKWSVGRSTN